MEWSCSLLVVTTAALPGFCQAQARNICLSSKRTPGEPEMGKQDQYQSESVIPDTEFCYLDRNEKRETAAIIAVGRSTRVFHR